MPLVRMTHFLITLGMLGVILSIQHCPTQPGDPPEPGLLSVEYTTATEVWLRVQTPDSVDTAGLRLYRSDSVVADFASARTIRLSSMPDCLPTRRIPIRLCVYKRVKNAHGAIL